MVTGDANQESGRDFLTEIATSAKRFSEFQTNLITSLDLTGVSALTEPYRILALKLKADSDRFTNMLKSTNFSNLLGQLGRETPYNYDELMIEEQYALIAISKAGNFGSIEVIPKSVIQELLVLEDEESEVDQILLSSKSKILATVLELVDAFIEEPKIKDYGLLLDRSMKALDTGHHEASQALSTALWDSFICARAGRKEPITSIKDEAKKPDIAQIVGFSPIYDYGAFGPALSAYVTPGTSAKYSRNGTIHHLSPNSANELNSIKAITIAAGILGRTWRTLPNSET